MLIYEHEGRGMSRFWPKEAFKTFDPNEENDNVVETRVTGMLCILN